MTEKYLSALWSAIAPGLANHLWQSTLVAAAVGALTLALRKNQARARYWLWLAASVKFLVPFSLLVRLGSCFAWHRPTPPTSTGVYFAIEEVSQPFSHVAVGTTAAHSAAISAPTLPSLLPILIAIWLCGFFAVLLMWITRWRRISAAMKAATPLSDGREVGALRRMERIAGIHKPIELLMSRASLEPGIFGIASPTLIWPEGISGRLEDPHLEAVLAHEVWHVRRRDNLFAALHMLVEAVFWFYPLVWWLGARLVEERERSCDEEVVALGSDRQVYAESILKVCEFCLGSPLPCVAGVTGADLKKRMVHIMTDRILHKLDFARKALLTVAADQFKLVVHTEAQKLPAYDLVADESGAKLQSVGEGAPHRFHLGHGELSSSGAPLELLAAQLSARLGKPVVDKTGLKGIYAFNLHWTPDPSEDEHLKQSGEPVDFGQRWSISPDTSTDANGPTLTNALQEQLGLKLQPNTEPVQMLVVEHAELPSGD